MGYKVVHLTRPCKIKVKNENLVLHFYDDESEAKVTLIDIDFILFDNTQFSITGKSLQHIAKHKIATLFIDEQFHPSSILIPYHQHSTMSEVAHAQINIPHNFKALVWKNIVVSKIQNQASVLEFLKLKSFDELNVLSNLVELYDKNQDEAQAARIYWKSLFNMYTFRRDQTSQDIINTMLNYSYSIIRACFAREISTSGMLSVFGLWHKNRYNAFALVDDLMEPFRPVCDFYVKKLLNEDYRGISNLSTDIKRDLVNILTMECIEINSGTSSVSGAIALFVRQYKKSMMSGEVDEIFFPTIKFEYFKNEHL